MTIISQLKRFFTGNLMGGEKNKSSSRRTARSIGLAFFAAYAVLLNALILPFPVTAKSTFAPAARVALKITPIVECVRDDGGGAFTALFGYDNPNPTAVSLAIGGSNQFAPSPADRGQLTVFQPGRNFYAFSAAESSGNLVWTLDGNTATAFADFPTRCPAVALSIASPSNRSSVKTATVTVTGQAFSSQAGAGGITSVTVNNLPAVYNSATARWSLENMPLVNGQNILTVKAVDGLGNQSTSAIYVNRRSYNYPSFVAVEPNFARQGQTLQVTLRGVETEWTTGEVGFYGDISVGGTANGVGSMTVIDETTAVVEITVSPTAALGPINVRIDSAYHGTVAELVLRNGFSIVPAAPPGAAGNQVTTIAGITNVPGFGDGMGARAQFKEIAGVAVGADDTIYVADAGNNRIRKVRPAAAGNGGGWTVSTLAGDGVAGLRNGAGNQARFKNPRGVAVGPDGIVYVADTGNNRIRRIALDGTVTTLAGGTTAGLVDITQLARVDVEKLMVEMELAGTTAAAIIDGSGQTARFWSPQGLAIDASGSIYVADTGNSAVRRISPSGEVVTVAGGTTSGALAGVADITIDNGNIYVYVSAPYHDQIRRIDAGGAVYTLTGGSRGFADGTATAARFARPAGIAVDAVGRLIVADRLNSLVRSVSPELAASGAPLAVTTLAGTGERGNTDGAGNAARFNNPGGVAVGQSSAIYVTDSASQTIRRIGLPPRIVSFSPTAGQGATTVTIVGENFDGRGADKNTVKFARVGGGQATAQVTAATRTQLTVVVPADAATGRITVSTGDGTATGAVDFTVDNNNQAPRITDFTPRRGTVGTAVKLVGTMLKAEAGEPAVTFAGTNGNRLPALVQSATAAEVNVLVPNGAVTGTIELINAGGRAVSPQPFVVDETQQFQITVAPSTIQAVERTTGTGVISLTSSNASFTQLARLTATDLPANVTATFDPANITAGATSTLRLNLANAAVASGSYSFKVKAAALVDGREVVKEASATLSVTAAGQTTLTGRVLNTDSEPVVGATASLDGRTATTDASGSFTLSGVTAGAARPLQIDGRTASAPNRTYPVITEPANIIAGQANTVPYIFYLPPIDISQEVTVIPGQMTEVKNVKVPGLDMMIPAGANLRNRDGSPVTRVSITPLAIDRTPTPLPAGVRTGMVYTSQPGGALTDIAIPVVYPNLLGVDPNTRVELYAFDHDNVRWYIYGYGRVSADGKTIAPEIDPNTGRLYGLRDFSWHFPNAGPEGDPNPDDSCPSPRKPDPDEGSSRGQNPVDYSTGMKIENATDLSFGGARGGIAVTRSYTSDNSAQAVIGRFGRGWKDNYEIKLTGNFVVGGAGRFTKPDEQTGQLFSYARTDPDGTLVFTSTQSVGQLASMVRKLTTGALEYRYGSGEVLRFDTAGKLTAIIDRNGNTTTLTYTGIKLTTITDAVGRTVTYGYDANNRVSSLTDPLGRVWQYGYNEAFAYGILSAVTDPLGNVTRYTYSSDIRLASITAPKGNVVKKLTYSNGRVIKQEFADGGIETYDYTLTGGIVTQTVITDPLGRTMTKRFNAKGYVIEQIDALGQKSKIERNLTNSLPTQTIGSCGCTEETREFDARGNKTATTDQQGNTTRAEYEPVFNNLTRVVDKLGRVSTFAYDANANLTSSTDALNRTESMSYDSTGKLTAARDALGQSEIYEYDQNGYLSARIDNVGKRWTMAYNAMGRMLSQTDPLGRKTSYAFDNLDRLVSITDASNAVTIYSYDANSNRISVRDALSQKWQMSHDAKDRLTKTTDPLGRVSRRQYNQADETVQATSPSGRTMRYEYDARGQAVRVFDGIGNTIERSYDYKQKLVGLKNERGHLTTFAYDELDRPIGQRNPLGQASSVSYDAAGRAIESTDELGRKTLLAYDAADRLERVNYLDAQVDYSYDLLNRVRQITDTAGSTVSWSYNALSQPLSETSASGTINYTYNAAGQRNSMTVLGRPAVNYDYDAAGRLSTITQGTEIFTYDYDMLSRTKSLMRPNGVTTAYEYDTIGRLKRLKHLSASNVAIEDLQYSYNLDDEISSLTSLQSATMLPTAKTSGGASEANRINQFGDNNYSYDERGQTTSKTDNNGTTAYVWDARGRLIAATLPNGQTVGYGYDAMGRRASKMANNQTTIFLYDGTDIVQDIVGANKVDYLNGASIDTKLRQSTNQANNLYFLQDHLGSTQGLTNATGGVAEWQRYTAYGESSLSSSLTRYGYTGRESDEVTGLMYYRARHYSPETGRFISQDPIGLEGGVNLYAYANNSPLIYKDPTGKAPGGDEPIQVFRRTRSCQRQKEFDDCAKPHIDDYNSEVDDLNSTTQSGYWKDTRNYVISALGGSSAGGLIGGMAQGATLTTYIKGTGGRLGGRAVFWLTFGTQTAIYKSNRYTADKDNATKYARSTHKFAKAYFDCESKYPYDSWRWPTESERKMDESDSPMFNWRNKFSDGPLLPLLPPLGNRDLLP